MLDLDELKKHLFIVVGEEHYTPLGVIRSLGENGIMPIAFILKSQYTKVASKSKYIKELYMVDDYDSAVEMILHKYGDMSVKPIVIPCDDIAIRSFDKKYDVIKDKFFINNAGESNRIAFYQKKDELYSLAEKYGLNVAKIWKTVRGVVPKDIIYPVITKPISSYKGWKQDYFVCNNESELKDAFLKIKGEEILLQQYIDKKTEMTYEGAAVNKGASVLFAITARYTYILPDYYSMAMVVDNCIENETTAILRKMFNEIQYEGIFEVEFMVDKDERLWFLEINYRNSTWSYASTCVGMNLPVLWASGMITKSIDDICVPIKKGYKAIAEIPDFEQRVRRFHMVSFTDWLKEIRQSDCLYFYNKNDLKPFISVWSYKVRSIMKKKLHIQ